MSAPVWVLSVDLQTKTATFQSGMADAAKSARGAFTDIKSGSGEMGREVGGNMMEARHGVMLLGEEFGIHLPRALTTFIASIGPIGAAMEAAFPFLAIAVGATLLIEALVKMHEEGEKLTQDQVQFATAVETAFNSLDQKLLQAGIRSDELRNDHLGALAKQLQLIDMQSMAELVHTFGELDKAADAVFEDLKSHWYTFGIGSVGAKHALDEFKTSYDNLLAKGKDKEASDLLAGTRESAEKTLAAQKAAASAMEGMKGKSGTDTSDQGKYDAAKLELKRAGVGYSEKEVTAQQILVDTLNAQVQAEGKIAELKKQESANTTRSAAGAMSSEKSQAARQAAEAQLRMGEMAVAADRATTEAQLSIQHASIAERLQSEIDFADRSLAVQMAGNTAQTAALDKLSKDYPNQLKAMQDKALELSAQHETAVAELTAKASIEQNNKELQDLQQGVRDKIEATVKGSAERLTAIDAAIKEEAAHNMQSLGSYRELLTQRVQAVKQADEEERKLQADAGREGAENELKMGELRIAALRETEQTSLSQALTSGRQKLQNDLDLANQEYAIQKEALDKEISALDMFAKDYENKKQALNNKLEQLDAQHANTTQQLNDQAAATAHSRLTAAQTAMAQVYVNGFTQVIMGKESMAHMLQQADSQIASSMLKNALMSIATLDLDKEKSAAKAARAAFNIGLSMGGPAGMVLGPVFGAAAFAAEMAFADGGVVPGVGHGDIVPAMLTPGEGIVPGSVMDGLSQMARSGNMGGGQHFHVNAPIHLHASMLDSDGMDKVLDKHGPKIQKHFETTLRKLNR
jgi:hypothetical protein